MEEEELFAQFERLREHLKSVEPIFEKFCESYGYQKANPISLGKYPRIRIEQGDVVHRWIELAMEHDPNDQRYTEFFKTIPYSLGAGCFVHFSDETKYGHRFQKSYTCFRGMPFNEVPKILRDELEKCLEIISGWTEEYLKKEGLKVVLG